ncbi:hypothetical protein [Croceicoccus naphthovorans]|uniref:hypothetical protein n=1 Tax=Croceicoccus naphthovorans TaxID=1348774 RepID=UPI0012E0C09C|nr:hypothetical protein [Croceicoccus naphthovorans]
MPEAGVKYGPAMIVAVLGAVNPVFAAIAFGMVAGWLALAAVLYDEGKTLPEIRRKLIVSLGVGSVGSLFAMWMVRVTNADPLVAAMIAASIAFGGVRLIKRLLNLGAKAVVWAAEHAMSDVAAARRREMSDQAQVDALMADHTVYPVDGTKPPEAVLTDDKSED